MPNRMQLILKLQAQYPDIVTVNSYCVFIARTFYTICVLITGSYFNVSTQSTFQLNVSINRQIIDMFRLIHPLTTQYFSLF